MLESHYQPSLPDIDKMEDLPPFIEEHVFQELEERKKAHQEEIDQLEKERAAIQHEVSIIESGGSYTEILHDFHQKKFELREMAKQWAVFQVAAYVLQKSMEKYKVERLPKVWNKHLIILPVLQRECIRKFIWTRRKINYSSAVMMILLLHRMS